MGFKARGPRLFNPRIITSVHSNGAELRTWVVRLKEDDPRFKLKAGDLLLVHRYTYDPNEKFTVVCRLHDHYDPQCNLYISQVERVDRWE